MSTKPNINTSTIKSDVLNKVAKASSLVPEPAISEATKAAVPNKDAVKFQHYKASRPNVRMVTLTGKPITFINFQFITADKDVIEYLDSEIDQGLGIITKGKLMTAEEADPMAALKRKIIAEYEAEKSCVPARDMGTTEGVQGSTALNPTSSQDHADLSGESTSVAS